MKVSIIILSYNTKDLLEKTLRSVFNHIQEETHEVIVVDNHSSDESAEMVKKDFPKAHLIENDENVGFAKGCNIGAMKAKGEYLLFLNSDIEIHGDAFSPLIKALEKDSSYAVAGGLLENSDGSKQRSFGAFYSLPNVFWLLFRGEKGELSRFRTEGVKEVDWVSGGFMLVRKDDFERVHGFDEQFFMYMEDMELCFRIHKAGKKVIFVPDAKIYHLGQGSSNRTFAIVHIYKGLQYFYKKHKNALQYTMVRLLLLVKGVVAIVAGLLTGNGTLAKTYSQALRTL